MDWNNKWLVGLLSLVFAVGSVTAVPVRAAAPESTSALMYYGDLEGYVNGEKVTLPAPVTQIDHRTYLPAAALPDVLGIPVKWEPANSSVQITTPAAFLSFDIAANKLSVNGENVSSEDAAIILDDRLYLELTWLNRYISYKATVNEELQRIELLYIHHGSTGFHNDTMPNTKPVAKFTVDKQKYRLGEPIRYTDLSYDPDGDTLTNVEWTGKAEAIFEPGLFKVSLQVTDSRGTVSEVYSHNVEIVNEPFLDPFQYKIYHEPVGTFVKEEEATLRKYLRGIPQLHKEVTVHDDRPLIVSDSPETFESKGYLYQEKVNGKARLYADHVNGMKEKVQFAIVVRNPNPDKSVTIKTTRHGEVYPSIYANLIGNEASVEFLQGEQKPDTMVVGPMQTAYYKKMPEFFPGQGMNVIYDVETDGEVYFSFVAMDAGAGLDSIGSYPQLEYNGHVRGTFDSSDVTWNVYASSFDQPSSLAIGDGITDTFVTGTDFFMKKDSLNLGNYGVVYNIHIDNPRKMAILLLPRGGVFRGPFEIDGKIVLAPPSGIMMDYQGYTILARTDGTEPALDIEFTPPAGSAFPVDVIFYPLENK
ncbi:copper amine oxidase N-terminal domain-containing protein [Paenibacillus xerothermodurans]|uniref:Copper amine oxidase N-terminal domain-containing protein n=1 Tax=Paenibacillus xerothermodurans TaxID=1977292 RepID=A0A2W1NSL0_PAEXE|nr:copper amine oxidase N-terminal domain-containing protein [Paenibacillus xerothermodurans]PZE21763.1 copper amine oxidase N-terminal domain-containing protein [Paenibacillus xerothermodurans]